jgi:hypothetical protein
MIRAIADLQAACGLTDDQRPHPRRVFRVAGEQVRNSVEHDPDCRQQGDQQRGGVRLGVGLNCADNTSREALESLVSENRRDRLRGKRAIRGMPDRIGAGSVVG